MLRDREVMLMIERAPGIYEVELHSSQLSINEIKIFIIKGKRRRTQPDGGRWLSQPGLPGRDGRGCLKPAGNPL